MNLETLEAALTLISEQKRVTLNKADVTIWGLVFSDVSDEEFAQGYVEFAKADIYPTMPQPGAIRQYIDKAREKARQLSLPTLSEAWEEVRSSLDHTAPKPEYSHPLIDRAVCLVGYRHLCEMWSEEASKQFRYTFRDLVDKYSDRDVTDLPRLSAGSSLSSLTDNLAKYRQLGKSEDVSR